MKELSIEEKARAYDEALSVARKTHQTQPMYRDWLEKMFPELAESEDERIRKAIYLFVEAYGAHSQYATQEDMLAWLEAQGEHAKFRESIQIGDKVTRNQDGVLVNLSQLNRVAKKDEKQGEQKSYISETMEEKHDFDSGFTKMMEKEQKPAECSEKDEINLEKAIWYVENPAPMVVKDSMLVEWLKNLRGRVQPQPKVGWSQEDEKKLQHAIMALQWYAGSIDIVDWLKSLKDRVQPQPKQEWSEEDEECIKWSINNLTELKDRFGEEYGKVGDCINFLKSLRPQNRWKPSDEQMKILNEVLNFAANHESPHWNDYIFGTLNNLIKQLKKLRDE